jgi:hypothetical protein
LETVTKENTFWCFLMLFYIWGYWIKQLNFIVRTGVVSLSLFSVVVWWWRQVKIRLVEKSKSQSTEIS